MSDQRRLLELQGASPEYIAYCASCWEPEPVEIHDDDDGAWDED